MKKNNLLLQATAASAGAQARVLSKERAAWVRSAARGQRGVRAAFTVMEIIIVIGLLAVLIGVLVGNLQGTSQAGRVETVKLYFNTTVEGALAGYQLNVGQFPTSDQGLMALRQAPAGLPSGAWRGPYLKADPVDPWGNAYRYRYPGTHNIGTYDIWSVGPNGIDENGEGDDIRNW